MTASAVPTAPAAESTAQLHRAMGFRDLLLFYLVTGFTVRWIGAAASAGPSAVVIWLGACLLFYVPLMLTVLELSSRYPNEGGCYVWSKRAFGDFAGFMTGWNYWVCNLPYFPGLFYFTAASALFIGGASWLTLADSPTYYVVFSLLALAVAVTLNVRGLGVGKWLHNIGAAGLWIPALLLMGLALVSWSRFGSATPFTWESLVPSTRLKDIIFWSTIAFSLSGLESASMMGDEIRDPRRNIPRALLIAGVLITVLYISATVAMLVALPQAQILSLQGFMLSIQQASRPRRTGWPDRGDRSPDHARWAGPGRRVVRRGGPAAVRRGDRPVSAAGVRPDSSSLRLAPREPADPGRDRRGVHLPGPGRHHGQGRVRRAREHGHHRVLHPVSLHVRLHDQAPGRAGGPRGDAGARRPAGGDRWSARWGSA